MDTTVVVVGIHLEQTDTHYSPIAYHYDQKLKILFIKNKVIVEEQYIQFVVCTVRVHKDL